MIPLRAVTSTKNQQLFEAVALKLWPKSSESPEQCGHEEYLSIEKRLMPHFDNFASLINPNELVEASIYWPPPATATSQVNILCPSLEGTKNLPKSYFFQFEVVNTFLTSFKVAFVFHQNYLYTYLFIVSVIIYDDGRIVPTIDVM